MKVLVVEIEKEDNKLKMSAFERIKGIDSTIKHHEECVSLEQEIIDLCEEITHLFNKSLRSEHLEYNFSEELKKIGRTLFDQLFTNKIKKTIKNTNAHFLVIAINEYLVNIPWELLHDGEEFLCIRFAMGRIVRTKQNITDIHQKEITIPAKMLIIADPLGDLNYAYEEGVAIRNELDKQQSKVRVVSKTGEVYLDFVKRNIRDYDIVHFAGHAEYNYDDPSKSGWILKDGVFTSRDIVTLGTTSPMPSIVFSNACQSSRTQKWETSEGFEDVIYGLANGFLLSGVRHYIGTFCKVEDKASLDFAKQFYKNIFDGLSVGEALRTGRIDFIKRYSGQSIIWSSYLLYGDPTLVLFTSKAKKKNPLVFLVFFIVVLTVAFISLRVTNMFKQPTIAVFKIEDLNTNKRNVNLAHVISANLSKLPNLNSLDIPSLLNQPELSNKTPKEVSKILGIDLAVDATYKNIDGQIKVNLNLGNPRTGRIYGTREFFVNNEIELEPKIISNLVNMLNIHIPKNKVIFDYPGTSNVAAYNLFSRTWELYSNGNYQEAISLCNRALELDSEYLGVYKRLGNLYDAIGNKEAALNAYTEYARLSEKKGDLENLANALINIGWIYHSNKDYEKAYDFYNQGVVKAIEANDKLREAKAYRQIAVWYRDKGQYGNSLNLLLKSLKINKAMVTNYNHKYDLGCDYQDLGILFSNKNEYRKALGYFFKSKNIFNSIGSQIAAKWVTKNISREYIKLGDISFKQNDYNKALFYYNKALKFYNLVESKPGLGIVYRCIGDVYAEYGDFDRALVSYTRSLELFSNLKSEEVRIGEVSRKIGMLYYKKGVYAKAAEYLKQALREYENKDFPEREQIETEIREVLGKIGQL